MEIVVPVLIIIFIVSLVKAYYEIKDKDIQKIYDYKIARQEGRIEDEQH